MTPTPLRTDQDHHVHTARSDDAVGSLDDALRAAGRRGLSRLVISDHVRRSTAWLPEWAATVRSSAGSSAVEVLCGVETKLLDPSGRLDLPPLPHGIDRVLIADHRWPTTHGPRSPAHAAAMIERRTARAEDLVDALVTALCGAVALVPMAQIAHPFSLLAKTGIADSTVTDQHLDALCGALRSSGAAVELNEKWSSPSPALLAGLVARGADLVAATDSHGPADIGVYRTVLRTAHAAGVAIAGVGGAAVP